MALYHEPQVSALCAVHCVNTLLHGAYFTEVDFSTIAQELDAKERSMMAEAGVESSDYLKFMAEDSGNVASDGMFSIQVISKALEVWNLECIPLLNPRAAAARADPPSQVGFICNLQEHWFTIRKCSGQWWNFNSLYPAPEKLSAIYLEAYLGQLRQEGYTIFWVAGTYPEHGESLPSNGQGRWLSPSDAERISKGAVEARRAGQAKASAERAMEVAARMGGQPMALSNGGMGGGGGGGGVDTEMQRALAASLGDAGGGMGVGGDDDLAAAIAASLADAGGGGGGGGGGERGAAAGGGGGGPLSASDLERAIAMSMQDATPAAPAAPVAPEPAPGVGTVDIAFRMPPGHPGGRLTRRFDTNAPGGVGHVLAFLASQGVDVRRFQVATAFPRAVLSEEGRTLASVGVTANCLLNVEPRR